MLPGACFTSHPRGPVGITEALESAELIPASQSQPFQLGTWRNNEKPRLQLPVAPPALLHLDAEQWSSSRPLTEGTSVWSRSLTKPFAPLDSN